MTRLALSWASFWAGHALHLLPRYPYAPYRALMTASERLQGADPRGPSGTAGVTPADAVARNRHTVDRPHLQRIWAAAVNVRVAAGMSEGEAIREANRAVAVQQRRKTGRDK